MNEQIISKTPDLPVKRKRGRPRKDETSRRPHPQPPPPLPPIAPAPSPSTTIQPPPPATTTVLPPVDHSLVGQAVTCIIDGIFDNGYLLSTRLGPSNSILRGVVFQQGHVAPVTPENDVAPHLKMCTRSEFPIPPANPRNPVELCTTTDQSVCVKQPGEAVAVQPSQNAPQPENLRLVEQDDVMQVFEVSKASEEPKDCDQRAENEHIGCDQMAESSPGKGSEIPVGNMNPEDITGMETEQHGNQDITGMESEQHGNEDITRKESEQHGNEDITRTESEQQGNQDIMIGMESEQHGNQDITGMHHEPVVEPEQRVKEPEELMEESKEQTGEVKKIDDANQDSSEAVGVDLSLSNFSK